MSTAYCMIVIGITFTILVSTPAIPATISLIAIVNAIVISDLFLNLSLNLSCFFDAIALTNVNNCNNNIYILY